MRSGFLFLLAVVAALGGCKRQQQAAPPDTGKPVMVATATAKDVPIYLDQIGRTMPRESVMIQPQISGKVLALHFTDGEDIKKGDLLFTIDERPFKAAAALAEATLAENRAKHKFAQDEIKRMEEIKSTGAVSITEYEQKVNAVAVAQAQVEWGQASLEQAKLNLEYCQVRSPIDGRAGRRLVDPGNVVNSGGPNGGTNLLLIQTLDPIYADFTVTENELGTVRKYMADGVLKTEDPQGKLKVFVDVPADAQSVVQAMGAASATRPATRPAGPREGVLTFLDNNIVEGAGTIRVRATLPNADRYFWPGQFVKVRLVLTTKSAAVLVPSAAIQIGQQGSFVFVVKPDSTAELRPVVTGQRQGELIVVDKGVSEGERVVTQGQMMLAPGVKVAVLPTPGSPAPTSQAVAQGSDQP